MHKDAVVLHFSDGHIWGIFVSVPVTEDLFAEEKWARWPPFFSFFILRAITQEGSCGFWKKILGTDFWLRCFVVVDPCTSKIDTNPRRWTKKKKKKKERKQKQKLVFYLRVWTNGWFLLFGICFAPAWINEQIPNKEQNYHGGSLPRPIAITTRDIRFRVQCSVDIGHCLRVES